MCLVGVSDVIDDFLASYLFLVFWSIKVTCLIDSSATILEHRHKIFAQSVSSLHLKFMTKHLVNHKNLMVLFHFFRFATDLFDN